MNKKEDLDDDIPEMEDLGKMLDTTLHIDSDSDEEEDNSFAKLATKMVNLTEDGMIKKRIIQEGKGEGPENNALVAILYCNYLEYSVHPTDFAHIRKPYVFRLGTDILKGLNIAVKSMKVNETSYFLIEPEYAFGKLGHPPRIPPNATFLFQIELIRYTNSGFALEFNNLSFEQKQSFDIAHKVTLGLLENGKEHVKHNVKLSIREYNRGYGLMQECLLLTPEQHEIQLRLLFRLLTNLAVCYNLVDLPKKCIVTCEKLFKMVKNTSLVVPCKIYFNYGRALFKDGNYIAAKEQLVKARHLEPNNPVIVEEMYKVNVKLRQDKEREVKLARKYFRVEEPVVKPVLTEKEVYFRQLVAGLCVNLLKSDEMRYALPDGFTAKEFNMAKMEVEKHGLKIIDNDKDDESEISFYIAKKEFEE